MRATVLDLRRNPRKIFDALARNEIVTLSKRGREIARIVPKKGARPAFVRDSPAFGLWKDRADMNEPAAYVRRLRGGRFRGL
jgi:antitoxin (DNA-binding transcriptional repressor) of toxin-antitoxin stability system